MNKKVTIIDYGSGNLLSLKRAFEEVGAEVVITNNKKKILDSSRVVLPGVGAFKNAMNSINNLGLINPIHDLISKDIPLLGICLGAQLILSESEEFGISKGLNLIEGRVVSIKKSFPKDKNFKVPHIGWCPLDSCQNKKNNDNILFNGLNNKDYFYFVHSFMIKPNKTDLILYKAQYENLDITAIIGKNNLYGFQFHPEKSGKSGLKILKNFLKL